ncbi:hypothetical protein LTR37_013292 [Vermiconidia calcicola]|uniref:Uncharacterized protein n=1 Tax=Vermiconidia calcicola TaxID=1690605 RepID=A0ACC3MWX3_9PEZI|nr:hypothetical protein LTR37_013292 [Vermiconidia calcicola]
MDPQLSQDSLSSLIPLPDVSEPATPSPTHATIPEGAAAAMSTMQSRGNASSQMTPPPSTQVPSSLRTKTRTPTPPMSHISTPPPTIEMTGQIRNNRTFGGFAGIMTMEQIETASLEQLRTNVTEIQAALQEAKMSAAHHKLQYQMLSQESAAAIERMVVEARMAQFEDQVIHVAEQARVAATPIQPSPFQDGMIPVQKDLYQRMCREIQQLTEERNYLANEHAHKDKVITRQDSEIASLTDKVMLMRDRIRENREHTNRNRNSYGTSQFDSTPRSAYNDPLRSGHPTVQTPHGRQPPLKVPSTAPAPRTSAMRTPNVYAQPVLPMSRVRGPPSEGTVSADEDSEAETDIIEQDEVSESQASRAASQMLRSSQEQQMKRASFQGSGMLQPSPDKLKQTKLFGAVTKGSVGRGGEPPAKRARTGEAVGLGIMQ